MGESFLFDQKTGANFSFNLLQRQALGISINIKAGFASRLYLCIDNMRLRPYFSA